MRTIKLTNTLTGKKEELKTAQEGKLSYYSCGPTVYGLIHIGNLRSGLVADMFLRYFQRVGYEVCYVRNYTDVDDKIIKQCNDEGLSFKELTEKYILEVEKDFDLAQMLEPTHKTRVTEHILEIIALIQKILDQGYAYATQEGDVFFSIDKYSKYGELSHKKKEDLVAGIRIEMNIKKKNPLDFVLWKSAKSAKFKDEPSWESPWGKGRPGWHIECSAMALKWLGTQIDVHHGGEDLAFPHHENEIAQAQAATGVTPFVRYWLHHAFLIFSKEKMSKSLGNVFTARDFLTQFSGELARYFFLSVHYRSTIDFNPQAIENAISGLHRIYEAKAKAQELGGQIKFRADLRAEAAWGEFLACCQKARLEIDEHYANDFNTPEVLGSIFSLIREFNRTLSQPLAEATPAASIGAKEFISILEEDLGGILGVAKADSKKALVDLSRMRMSGIRHAEKHFLSEIEIMERIEQRAHARQARDFEKADKIRKSLEEQGVLLKDNGHETVWEYG